MCLPVYNCLSVCLRICSAPVQKHVGSQYVIFHFVLANKLFWWVCQYRKSCQYVVNLILMSVQKNTLFASIFFFHTVCQYIFFSFCTGIGKCWYASTKKSILYWHEDRDFYDARFSSVTRVSNLPSCHGACHGNVPPVSCRRRRAHGVFGSAAAELLRVLDVDHWSHQRPRSSPGQVDTSHCHRALILLLSPSVLLQFCLLMIWNFVLSISSISLSARWNNPFPPKRPRIFQRLRT